MFERFVPGEVPASSFERCLAAADLRAVDLVDPGLLWGREFVLDPSVPLHRAGPVAGLRSLLDAGAAALDRAADASREIARLSAVVASSLATFARCRPGAVLDRQPGERGAMSAATRAARPAALTEVSEWAVDEVALALHIPPRTAEGRLAEAVLLAERLPLTLELLRRGAEPGARPADGERRRPGRRRRAARGDRGARARPAR